MIKKLIDKIWGNDRSGATRGRRVDVPKAEHGIDPELLDERAVRVVRTLQESGFEAYIVGGAVRDLLVGLRPQDFDVATDATPEQVKNLFRRAFIIGRRFRIVHVVFGRGRDHETIEVSTFRANVDASATEQVVGNERTAKAALAGKSHAVDASGRVLRDNVWGPQIEDAARRDFTVNAMYYDPAREIVVDYHGGIKDAKKRVLRMIGDADARYREDPVRLIRAVRFAAKLGFDIEAKSRAPMKRMAPLLANVPVSRLFDEMIKLLQTGHALRSLEELRKQGLHKGVFPVLDAALDECALDGTRNFVRLALEDTDLRVEEGRAVAPSFMLACLLWQEVQDRWSQLKAAGESTIPALQNAIDTVFDDRIGDISGRGKLAADMREIWMMQPRFDRRTGNAPHALVEQARFRAGYDFLRLRADAGEVALDLADWWEDFALGSAEDREALVALAKEAATKRRHAGHDVAADGEHDGDTARDADATTGKRRRRRRRGAAKGGGSTGV